MSSYRCRREGFALIVTIALHIHAQNVHDTDLEPPPDPTRKHLSADAFVKFVKKFDPVDVFDRVDKIKRANHRNISLSEYTDMIFEGIDSSAALLKLKVQNGNPRVLAVSSRRQESIKNRYTQTFTAPPGLSIYSKDRFMYRDRLYELMKQAIYQARNKMVIMQLMRKKYRGKKMFKMGYLVSKTDTACKIFNKVCYHAWRHCFAVQKHMHHWAGGSAHYYQFNIYDMMMTHMRMLHLWFQAELLTDLVIKNDVAYHEAYSSRGRWNFTE